MQRWEYKTLRIDSGFPIFSSDTNPEVELNELGDDGWELVDTIIATGSSGTETKSLILKRPKDSAE
ncbi:hypothetical protein AUR64_17695 [Haloprofundus marisrubri]|uniref:DUF4177 domain-containing protein n=1 Tax=Haloprofundus marisrubri TaxID=1514971 RepID=A0A0W1R608_9EURY|nr:DUF4177 domain-containing protein [Haloprofundus marisrubri]KTG08514.1 hypothetical protein AUR64_17695 [Haloprofundus marisrubri]